MCDSGKGETFCEKSKKKWSARKISRCARNDGMGGWVYFTQRTTDMFGKRRFRNVIPSEVEGSFQHTGIASYVRQRKRGNLFRREQERAECKEDFSTVLEMTVWGKMGLFYVAYNGYVWKALFLHRHPERSRGIFLAYRYSVLCETAEKGKTFAKGARKSRVQGRFLAALEMTVWGNGFISRSVQRICLESAIPRNVIPSEVEGSF